MSKPDVPSWTALSAEVERQVQTRDYVQLAQSLALLFYMAGKIKKAMVARNVRELHRKYTHLN